MNNLYQVGLNNSLTQVNFVGTFTARIRNVFTDRETNANVTSEWAYATTEIPAVVMSAPKSVSLSSVPSDNGKSFGVTVVAKKRPDVTGYSYNWDLNETQLVNAKLALYDTDGKELAKYTHLYTAAEKETFATADVFLTVSPSQFSKLELTAGEYIYAEAKITYGANVGGKFVTSEGSASDRNAVGSYLTVAPNVEVSQVILSQNPPLVGAAGDRQVDSGGMVSLTITARVKLNELSYAELGSSVRAFMPSSNGPEHVLTYQSLDGEYTVYKSVPIAPNPTFDYKKAVVVVIISHPASSNGVAFKVLQ
jgi:hypothetical protein